MKKSYALLSLFLLEYKSTNGPNFLQKPYSREKFDSSAMIVKSLD